MEKYHYATRMPKQLRRLLRIINYRFYIQTNYDLKNSIFIAGTGRSGTTWLAELIASQINSRLIFEPFHFERVIGNSRYHLFQYMRSDDVDDELYEYSYHVISGRLRNKWVDWHNKQLISKYRIIKEVRANLFLKWLYNKFPATPFFFVIRHPCAVVLSRTEMNWATDLDIEPFLHQPLLLEDHLADKLDMIRLAQTDVEKHAVIWCVTNAIPLRQFKPNEVTPIFYEKLCLYPDDELAKVINLLRLDQHRFDYTSLYKPSITSSDFSAVVTREDRVMRWKDHLSVKEIDAILNIVQAFGLDHIYSDSPMPIVSELFE
jgi:hypothetical protein